MKKKVIAAIGFCGLMLSTSVNGMDLEYGVENGLLGMKRDVVLKLMKFAKFENEKLKSVTGLSGETFLWKNHRAFKLSRQSVLNKRELDKILKETAYSVIVSIQGRTYDPQTMWPRELSKQLITHVVNNEFEIYNCSPAGMLRLLRSLSNRTITVGDLINTCMNPETETSEKYFCYTILIDYPRHVAGGTLQPMTVAEKQSLPVPVSTILLSKTYAHDIGDYSQEQKFSRDSLYFMICPEEELEFYFAHPEFTNGEQRYVIKARIVL